MQAGPELDAAIGKLMGLDVLGVSECSREPEYGEWEPTDHWAELGYEGAPRPVHVRHCWCEFAEDDDVRIFGHISFCLQVVPAYSTDIAAVWLVVERLLELGWRPLMQFTDEWVLTLSRDDSLAGPGAVAKELPLAICRTALEAVAP